MVIKINETCETVQGKWETVLLSFITVTFGPTTCTSLPAWCTSVSNVFILLDGSHLHCWTSAHSLFMFRSSIFRIFPSVCMHGAAPRITCPAPHYKFDHLIYCYSRIEWNVCHSHNCVHPHGHMIWLISCMEWIMAMITSCFKKKLVLARAVAYLWGVYGPTHRWMKSTHHTTVQAWVLASRLSLVTIWTMKT